MQIQKPRFGGAFFYTDANALYAFKSRGFGGEIGVVTSADAYLDNPLKRLFRYLLSTGPIMT